MEDDQLEDLKAVLAPLLQSLEALEFIARFLDPPRFEAVLAAAGTPDEALRQALRRLGAWPDALDAIRLPLRAAAEAALAGFSGLREADDLSGAYRALRHIPRAQEALYPLAEGLPPVNRYFLEPSARQDPQAQARCFRAAAGEASGVFHVGDAPGERGGVTIYAPEFYEADRAWPLVVALHGGSGAGRGFLWTWLRAARTHGAILIAPTAVGETWALNGADEDTPNLARLVEAAGRRWRLDPKRLLLTGMSDGGTFTYLTGLTSDLPFTHLAPVSAAFHPMMAQMADPERVRERPIFITHGALDWMFPVESARLASQALAGAGARVTFREIDDLSHTYPREINAPILDWLAGD